jgi:hypothetical protein
VRQLGFAAGNADPAPFGGVHRAQIRGKTPNIRRFDLPVIIEDGDAQLRGSVLEKCRSAASRAGVSISTLPAVLRWR